VYGVSLHFLGNRTPGGHGARVPRAGAQWHTSFLSCRPNERRRLHHCLRSHGEAGRWSVCHCGARLHIEPGARRRALRSSGAQAGSVRGHRCALHQRPGRTTFPQSRSHAFDAAYLQHQLPGGMVGTMRRHLAESRVSQMEGAVIEELGRVREELGWPIVMTPFSQILLTLAVMNVTNRERYKVFPDEAIRYAIGRFGKPNVPIDARVMDRIESLPRAKELRSEAPMASVAELRRQFGERLSDEEFLLRATMPAAQVDAMLAAGAAPRYYNPALRPVMSLIRQLTERRDLSSVSVEKPGFRLSLRRWAQLTSVAPR